jgi:hypothetical protein
MTAPGVCSTHSGTSRRLCTRRAVAAFTRCYHAGIQERVTRRRESGPPAPEHMNMTPSVDVD